MTAIAALPSSTVTVTPSLTQTNTPAMTVAQQALRRLNHELALAHQALDESRATSSAPLMEAAQVLQIAVDPFLQQPQPEARSLLVQVAQRIDSTIITLMMMNFNNKDQRLEDARAMKPLKKMVHDLTEYELSYSLASGMPQLIYAMNHLQTATTTNTLLNSQPVLDALNTLMTEMTPLGEKEEKTNEEKQKLSDIACYMYRALCMIEILPPSGTRPDLQEIRCFISSLFTLEYIEFLNPSHMRRCEEQQELFAQAVAAHAIS